MDNTIDFIVDWLKSYANQAGSDGFVIGISGGIDSAVTSTLCARTGLKVIALNLPIRQAETEYQRAEEHIKYLKNKFSNVSALEINLSHVFSEFENALPSEVRDNKLGMANSRARLRMTSLYAVAQANSCLVVGTGNKIEDVGIGFFTKYGDGGVDLSPIADLKKSEVWEIGRALRVSQSIIDAKPTDGLWGDDRNDEDQIGATYPELEWAMDFKGDESSLSIREREVLAIYLNLNRINQHKMKAIPVCIIPRG